MRAVGEIISRWNGRDSHEQWLTGFENHGGYTRLGSGVRPLATVEIGIGNCNDGTEGAVAGTVIGTYPHGPILARNPALADHVLELALGHGSCHRWSVPRSTSSGGNGLRGSVDQVRVPVACPGCRPDSSAMEVDDSYSLRSCRRRRRAQRAGRSHLSGRAGRQVRVFEARSELGGAVASRRCSTVWRHGCPASRIWFRYCRPRSSTSWDSDWNCVRAPGRSYTPVGAGGLLIERKEGRITRESFRALTGDDREYQGWMALEPECGTWPR